MISRKSCFIGGRENEGNCDNEGTEGAGRGDSELWNGD
jgi:hypothetical protein